MKAVVLGAGGGIGATAARTMALSGEFDELVLADLDPEAAADAAATWPQVATPIRTAAIDVSDDGALVELLTDADLVVNCVGPFYRYGPPTLAAALSAGVPYVDVCDDLSPTLEMLDLHDRAVARGVPALIGMGNSPGLANVLVRYCADTLLDTVTDVDIMHIHGGETTEGPAVLKHRIHAMMSDVPVWTDGHEITVRMLEPSGAEFISDVDFRQVGTYPVYPYPHPETVTLPRHLPGLRRATNRGVVFPLSYFTLTADLVRAGVCGTEPLQVYGEPVVPVDFAVAHLMARRPALLAEAGITEPGGCLRIDVAGEKDGATHRYVFSLSSQGSGAAEGTGIPAALAAILMARGELATPGVHPPEAIVDPMAMLTLATQLLPRLDVAGTGGSLPIHIAHIDPDGAVSEVDLFA
ncbi:MAG: saccharopine dehydrogenase NADP-binding domain-containing protein [Candidatus Nanopelagicales bacterium]